VGIVTLDDVRRWPERLAAFSPEADAERRELKQFLYDELYNNVTLKPEKVEAQQVVTRLFDYWMEHPDKLPPSHGKKAARSSLARVVCDYIAGMTDNFILEQHRKTGLRS